MLRTKYVDDNVEPLLVDPVGIVTNKTLTKIVATVTEFRKIYLGIKGKIFYCNKFVSVSIIKRPQSKQYLSRLYDITWIWKPIIVRTRTPSK